MHRFRRFRIFCANRLSGLGAIAKLAPAIRDNEDFYRRIRPECVLPNGLVAPAAFSSKTPISGLRSGWADASDLFMTTTAGGDPFIGWAVAALNVGKLRGVALKVIPRAPSRQPSTEINFDVVPDAVRRSFGHCEIRPKSIVPSGVRPLYQDLDEVAKATLRAYLSHLSRVINSRAT